MKPSPLTVIAVEENRAKERRENPRVRQQAAMELLWRREPHRFDSKGTATERLRLTRSCRLIEGLLTRPSCRIADLGCGDGALAHHCALLGASVDALDVAALALARLHPHPAITPYFDCLPTTELPGGRYDLVLCCDVIAYLEPQQHRLLIDELARLLAPEGRLLLSTPIDPAFEDGLEQLSYLLQTAFLPLTWVVSHHWALLRILEFLDFPRRSCRPCRSKKRWVRTLSKAAAPLSRLLAALTTPLHRRLSQSEEAAHLLEKLSRLLWGKRAITHAITIAKARPLLPQQEESEKKSRRLSPGTKLTP